MSVLLLNSNGMSAGSLFCHIGGFFSPTSRHILCKRHYRGMLLQPAIHTDIPIIDDISSYPDCPFCKGGKLHGQYSKYRSQRKLSRALELLEAELRLDEEDMRQIITDDLAIAAITDGDAYRDHRNAERAVQDAVKEAKQNAMLNGEFEECVWLEDWFDICAPAAIEQTAGYWNQDDVKG